MFFRSLVLSDLLNLHEIDDLVDRGILASVRAQTTGTLRDPTTLYLDVSPQECEGS